MFELTHRFGSGGKCRRETSRDETLLKILMKTSFSLQREEVNEYKRTKDREYTVNI